MGGNINETILSWVVNACWVYFTSIFTSTYDLKVMEKSKKLIFFKKFNAGEKKIGGLLFYLFLFFWV